MPKICHVSKLLPIAAVLTPAAFAMDAGSSFFGSASRDISESNIWSGTGASYSLQPAPCSGTKCPHKSEEHGSMSCRASLHRRLMKVGALVVPQITRSAAPAAGIGGAHCVRLWPLPTGT